MVPKGSRPAARNRTKGWLAQCGGGMWRGIWFVRVGYCLISCLVAISPPADHSRRPTVSGLAACAQRRSVTAALLRQAKRVAAEMRG